MVGNYNANYGLVIVEDGVMNFTSFFSTNFNYRARYICFRFFIENFVETFCCLVDIFDFNLIGFEGEGVQ